MWSSQEWSQDSQSTDVPPRDVLVARGISPKRKKRPTSHFQGGGLTFKLFGQGTQGTHSNFSQDAENIPLQPTVFGISQESMGASQSQFSQSQQYSQMSQDFTDRMGGLAVPGKGCLAHGAYPGCAVNKEDGAASGQRPSSLQTPG